MQGEEEELAEDGASEPTVGEIQAQLEQEMQSAEEDRLLEVSFVSRVREEARVIELYDESDHVARLRLDQVVTVRTAARRNWSARCEGRTVAVWTVREAGERFEISAGTKLGKQRAAGRRAAATRGRSRYDPDDEAARPQWAS